MLSETAHRALQLLRTWGVESVLTLAIIARVAADELPVWTRLAGVGPSPAAHAPSPTVRARGAGAPMVVIFDPEQLEARGTPAQRGPVVRQAPIRAGRTRAAGRARVTRKAAPIVRRVVVLNSDGTMRSHVILPSGQ